MMRRGIPGSSRGLCGRLGIGISKIQPQPPQGLIGPRLPAEQPTMPPVIGPLLRVAARVSSSRAVGADQTGRDFTARPMPLDAEQGLPKAPDQKVIPGDDQALLENMKKSASQQKESLPWHWLQLPLRWTSQEKWFLDEATTRTNKVTIITAPRGYRKSWTAQRVCARGSFLRPWFRFVYVDSDTFDVFSEEEKKRVIGTLLGDGYKLLLTLLIAGTCALLWALVVQGKSTTDAAAAVWNELPSPWAIFALLVIALSAGQLRRRVLVFDDVTRMKPVGRTDVPVSVAAIRSRLNDISGLQLYGRVVIVSSNEALQYCYSDGNDSVRITKSMPPATSQELLMALRDSRCPMTLEQLEQYQKKALEHHGNSIRFFISLNKFAASSQRDQPLRPYEALKPEADLTNPDHRAALWHIVDVLDLECEEALGAATLCLSPLVSLRDSAERMGFRLDPLIAADCVVPRRLALLSLMAMTAPDCSAPSEMTKAKKLEQAALQNAIKTLMKVKSDQLKSLVDTALGEYLRPLVEAMLRKLPATESAMYISFDLADFAYVCFVRVTLPSDKVVTTDVAATLRNEKLPRTVDGLREAVLKKFHLKQQGKDVSDVTVFPPGKEKQGAAYDKPSTRLEVARDEAPYHVVVV